MNATPEEVLEVARRAGVASGEGELAALGRDVRGALERLAAALRERAARETLRDGGGLQPESAVAHGSPLPPGGGGGEGRPHLPAAPLGVVGRYLLLEEIGRGGMGIVYRAHDPRLDRACAVKVPALPDASAATLARFAREARGAARLGRHPNIVPVFDYAETPRPHIAMALVDGRSLDEILRANGPLAPRRAADLARRVALALDHAHRQGLVHRDVKPSNILIDAAGDPHVTDFGLAKDLADAAGALSREGALLGTPAYMPPEQAERGAPAADARGDVYSLGAVLYHCLTGRPPFEGPSAVATIARVLGEEPERPRRVRPAIPRDLETIVLRALEKDPARRQPSAAELAEDLRRFLDGEPILSARTPLAVRIARRARRRPFEAATALAILVAGALFGHTALERHRTARRQSAEACLALDLSTLSAPWRIGIATAALEADPTCFAALYLRGRLHKSHALSTKAEDHRRRAEEDLTAAIALRPDLPGPYVERALLRRLSGAPAGSYEADFARAAALDRRSVVAHYARGRIAIDEGRIAEAVGHLERAVAADPTTAEAWADLGTARVTLGEDERGIAALDRAIALDAGSLEALVARSIARLRQGDARGALSDADAAVRLGYADPTAFAARSGAFRYIGELEPALADADAALAIAPEDAGALVQRAYALGLLERFAEARASVEPVLARAPGSPAALLARAFVLLLRGEDAAALADVEAVLARGDPAAEPLLVRSSLRWRAGDAPGAREDLDAAIALAPRAADLLVRRSVVRAALMDVAGALADAERAVEIAPGDPRPLEARARLRRSLGDLAGARADLDAAIAADARRPDGLVLRGTARLAEGDLDGAEGDLRAALTRHPGSARAALGLARVAVRRGDPEGARTRLAGALAAARPVDETDLAAAPELREIASDVLAAMRKKR